MGTPRSPVSSAIPPVDPSANTRRYAAAARALGIDASASAVMAPVPARPCAIPTRNGLRATVHERTWKCPGSPACACEAGPWRCVIAAPRARSDERTLRTPRPINIADAASSNNSAQRSGSWIRQASSSAPVTSKAAAWPAPQNAPWTAARKRRGCSTTSADIAARWSGSSAWRRPMRNPSQQLIKRVNIRLDNLADCAPSNAEQLPRRLAEPPAQVVGEPAPRPAVLPALHGEPGAGNPEQQGGVWQQTVPAHGRRSSGRPRAHHLVGGEQQHHEAGPGRQRVVLLAQRAPPGPRSARRAARAEPRQESRHARAVLLEPSAASAAQELFFCRDDRPVLRREEDGHQRQQDRIVRDDAQADGDEQVAEVERVARPGVWPRGVQLRRDQPLVLPRCAVRHLSQHPRPQRLPRRAQPDAGRAPRRSAAAAAPPDERHGDEQQRQWREPPPPEQRLPDPLDPPMCHAALKYQTRPGSSLPHRTSQIG